ncbi:MAG: type II CAAX endopeptidase family protein [Caldilineaceae bacterium]
MTTRHKFIARHSLPLYFILTFGLTWGSILAVTGPGGLPIAPEVAEQLGPLIYLGMLIGPSVAGLLLLGFVDGRNGYHVLLTRLLRWRVGVRWYAVALLTAPLTITTATLILVSFSPDYLPSIITADDKVTMLLTSVVVGLVVALCEEIGWTGFAIPQLRRRYGVVATGLIVGVLWGAWHFPPFWESDTFLGGLPLALLLARLFAWLPAYRVLMVWVYDHTESLLVVMLMHVSLVASQFVLFPIALAGMTALVAILVWAAILWVVVAAVAVTSGWQISHQPVPRGI